MTVKTICKHIFSIALFLSISSSFSSFDERWKVSSKSDGLQLRVKSGFGKLGLPLTLSLLPLHFSCQLYSFVSFSSFTLLYAVSMKTKTNKKNIRSLAQIKVVYLHKHKQYWECKAPPDQQSNYAIGLCLSHILVSYSCDCGISHLYLACCTKCHRIAESI